MKTESSRARNLQEEGTVFWLLVSGISTGALASNTVWYAGFLYLIVAFTLAILQLGLAFVCWRRWGWGFLLSILSAVVFAGFSFQILYSPVGVLLFVLQLQIIFFAYLSLRHE